MPKKFNVTGTCVPEKHYMVDISDKLEKITVMIDEGHYFTINRPRQYGKTTTISMLLRTLKDRYLVIRSSFEGIGDVIFESEKEFSGSILHIFYRTLRFIDKEQADRLLKLGDGLKNLREVSEAITIFVKESPKPVLLMIDEVDKSSNNQLFLSFLGMLRDKYLLARDGLDYTFHSVILAGVHDVKNLKRKIRPDQEKTLNSPWNIAADFNVRMGFSVEEITTILREYTSDTGIEMNIGKIAGKIYYYTSGYPFLVSKLCKVVVEDILPVTGDLKWEIKHLQQAVQIILKQKNTNFASLIKNLENNQQLYDMVFQLIMDGEEKGYNSHNPMVELGELYGIFKNSDGKLKIHNKIYEQIIYNYMSSKLETDTDIGSYNYRGHFITENGDLDFKHVLLKFQEFMKKEYSNKDKEFLERNGRLLFLAFLRPIINGEGYDFKEVQISEEKRLDVVITYHNKCYVVEMKIWHGEKAHQRGLKQLCGYLDSLNMDRGYLLIYDFRKKKKEWKQEEISMKEAGKEIFSVWI